MVADANGKLETGLAADAHRRAHAPAPVVERLRPCAHVAVLSTGRFQGRRGLLPDEIPLVLRARGELHPSPPDPGPRVSW